MAKTRRTQILEAVHKKALGFEAVEHKESVEEDDTGKRKIKTEKAIKRLPPDLDAAKLWLEQSGRGGSRMTVVTAVPRPTEDED